MARQNSAIEFNNFVAGLITEASPLNFPPNATLDEENFVLNRDGSRRRRLGVDKEDFASVISTSITAPLSTELAIEVFRWKNAGGDARKTLIVVQIGNEVKVFDASSYPLSQNLLHTQTIDSASPSQSFSFASVDGNLVIAAGTSYVHILKYENGIITQRTSRLLIRDLFGVEDVAFVLPSGDTDLRDGQNITIRPVIATDQHIYNLRNQTWALPRKVRNAQTVEDLISHFQANGGFTLPSNSDVVTYSLYPDTSDVYDKLTDRFNWVDVAQNPIGSTPAPRGYFIIDALDRGNSRLSQINTLYSQYTQLAHRPVSLPLDRTPGGATCISEYGGRIFYAGFSGEVQQGDRHSPNLSSYVLFSQLVDDMGDITACYQQGDPTSKEQPDLVDTDGGFIRIDGAYGITRMINLGPSLVVIASNGVWKIQGGSDYGFSATNYSVSKIGNSGCSSPGSVVQVENSLIFWGEDGIFTVSQNQYGDYVSENISQTTIQSLYEEIDSLDRQGAKGVYDSYERKVYWIFGNRIASGGSVYKLVFDVTLGAFYKFRLRTLEPTAYPKLAIGFNVPPYRLSAVLDDVTVNGEQVTAGGDVVSVSAVVQQSQSNETYYLILTGVSPVVQYTFGLYKNDSFNDWESFNGVGVDAKAYMLTGWMNGGDNQRKKQTPYITFHFNKTESGFDNQDGDWVPRSPSSCLVSSQWDWSNSPMSGKWSQPFQAYRFRRHFFPTSIEDSFDNGFATVVTRSKLRGSGKCLSLKIETEPNKDCYLLGWSMIMDANGYV